MRHLVGDLLHHAAFGGGRRQPSDRDLEIQDRRAVDRLQRVDQEPAPVPLIHGHTVRADRVRPVGRAGGEYAGQRQASIVARCREDIKTLRRRRVDDDHLYEVAGVAILPAVGAPGAGSVRSVEGLP